MTQTTQTDPKNTSQKPGEVEQSASEKQHSGQIQEKKQDDASKQQK